ncbi:hypothetical protein AB0M43_21480 [Longispora sp. NPDC051575]|uniref:hypothetical protein n=1 Tax=Longispora sp. NPDC051575 TaxID=3154943 RepID=UPI003436CD0B
MNPVPRRLDEQLIGALVPTAPHKAYPCPATLPALAVLRQPTYPGSQFLLGMARPDRSGRITERTLLAALRWGPGRPVDMDTRGGALIVSGNPSGLHVVGGRRELALPSALRDMCGIVPGQSVLLAAMVEHDLLVIHSAGTVASLLAGLHARITGAGDVC